MFVENKLAPHGESGENRSMPSSTPAAVPGRRTQADRSAATRDALVGAARRLFAAQGFTEVPADAIVAEAGVSRGALYHQFADKTALFEATLDAVEADVARRLTDDVAAAGITDPVEALRRAMRTWLDICVEPDIHRIALIDGPSVLGWARWREVCHQYVFGLTQDLLAAAIGAGLIRPQPARPLAHALMGAGDEAALYVAEAADPAQARVEMISVLDQLIAGVTVPVTG
jgi:AcrR family transcriptional regulator